MRYVMALLLAFAAYSFTSTAASARGCGPTKIKRITTGECITRAEARSLGIRVSSRFDRKRVRKSIRHKVKQTPVQVAVARAPRSIERRINTEFENVRPRRVPEVRPASAPANPAFGTLFPQDADPDLKIELDNWIDMHVQRIQGRL